MSRISRSVLIPVCLVVLGLATSGQATIRNINVGNFFFTPTHTVANVGDTIQWSFVAGVHTTTSDPSSLKSWDSGNRSSGTFRIVINPGDGPGPFPYRCTLHNLTMIDTIFVSSTNDGDGDGTPDISDNCPFVANPTQVDADMDQYGAACDCDDTRPDVHPGATEIVDDGIDQDCSGADAVTCFVDSDQDGFGTNLTVIAEDGTCDAAQSEAPVSMDCNDGNPAINPGASDTPDDGIDQDCNGVDAVTCFVDSDMDGFGSVGTVVAGDGVCDLLDGEASAGGDCDDTNPTIFPGATEIPDDGIDQDCNGSDLSGSCCVLRVGDANGNGDDEPTIGDVSVLIDAKFISGTCDGLISCLLEADVNQSGGPAPVCDDITIGDISILIDYLFITGPSLGLNNCL